MKHKRGILTVTGPFETSEIKVLDVDLRERAAGVHVLQAELDPGIYRVRVRVPGDWQEKLVAVEAGSSVSVDDFAAFTIASRQAFSATDNLPRARRESLKSSVQIEGGRTSRLFVFAQKVLDEHFLPPAFVLLDRDGRVKAEFPQEGVVRAAEGWFALTVDLPPGTYILEHDVPALGRRSQALFTSKGWETQVVAKWTDTVDFGQAILSLCPLDAVSSPSLELVAALDGLSRGGLDLSLAHRVQLLSAESVDPMMGLAVCYALLAQPNVNYQQVQEIAHRLVELLPQSMDAALVYLLAEAGGSWPTPRPQRGWPDFNDPPVFAVGTEQLMRLAAEIDELCPYNALVSEVAIRSTDGSVWTRWASDVSVSLALRRLEHQLRKLLAEGSGRTVAELARIVQLPRQVVYTVLQGNFPAVKPSEQRDVELASTETFLFRRIVEEMGYSRTSAGGHGSITMALRTSRERVRQLREVRQVDLKKLREPIVHRRRGV